MATTPAPGRWDFPILVDDFTLTFDPADKANGSLYLCTQSPHGHAEKLAIAALRDKGVWSGAEPKQVQAEQKEAYKSQLQFIEARDYQVAGETVVLLRCDHPKFPSDADRFAQWNQAVQGLADVNAS